MFVCLSLWENFDAFRKREIFRRNPCKLLLQIATELLPRRVNGVKRARNLKERPKGTFAIAASENTAGTIRSPTPRSLTNYTLIGLIPRLRERTTKFVVYLVSRSGVSLQRFATSRRQTLVCFRRILA